MSVAEAIARHKLNPNVSIDDYARQQRIELAREIEDEKKVYLDTKFWLLLRDVRMHRPSDSSAVALLDLLIQLVSERRVVCPISASTFVEIFTQSDRTSLKESVELIDELSKGLSLIEERERFRLEFYHFVIKHVRGADSVRSLDAHVWTKLAYVLGFVTPQSKQLPPDVNLVVQKAFLDHMWSISLADMLREMGDGVNKLQRKFPDISASLNDGKFANLDVHKSLKQVFLSEVEGILDVFKPDLASLMQHLYEIHTGRLAEVAADPDVDGQMFANLIYHAFRLNKLTSEMPSLRVSAGLHAAVRWDKTRKYRANDLHDFHHAVAAIPYCDFFLTEHSLCQLVSHNGLGLTKLFRCRAISSPAESVKTLSRLRGSKLR